MTEYKSWSIRVIPFSRSDRWRATVDVWPPDRDPRTHAGIRVRFADSAPDQQTVIREATQAAQRYIDASQPKHQ